MSERLFGASVRRREDARLVTGRGRYVADVALPEVLHVAVHRSPHAHARIARIEVGEARRRPGVIHVLVPSEVAALGRLPLLVPHSSLIAPACPEILPRELVSYAGQPVALVGGRADRRSKGPCRVNRARPTGRDGFVRGGGIKRAGLAGGQGVTSRATQKDGVVAREQ